MLQISLSVRSWFWPTGWPWHEHHRRLSLGKRQGTDRLNHIAMHKHLPSLIRIHPLCTNHQYPTGYFGIIVSSLRLHLVIFVPMCCNALGCFAYTAFQRVGCSPLNCFMVMRVRNSSGFNSLLWMPRRILHQLNRTTSTVSEAHLAPSQKWSKMIWNEMLVNKF